MKYCLTGLLLCHFLPLPVWAQDAGNAKDGVHAHAGFNIDWGPGDGTGMQPGRGHRRALMDTSFSSSLSNTGIAMVPDNNFGDTGGAFD